MEVVILRVLITGIAGFVGSHLAEYLHHEKNWEIFGLYRPGSALINLNAIASSLKLVSGDIREAQTWQNLLGQIRPDFIFHLAAQAVVSVSLNDPTETLITNILGEINLLQAVRQLDYSPRIITIASAEEYGRVNDADLPVKETTPFRPTSPYAVSKITQDMLSFQYHMSYKLDTVRLRPFNHTGPRQNDSFVIPAFARQIAEIEAGITPPLLKVGNLKAGRDFTDVRDMVRAYVLAAELAISGEVYNIGSGEAHTIQEVLTGLRSLAKVEIKVEEDPERLRPSDVPLLVCDGTKFFQQTGWERRISFEQMLVDVLDYWRARTRVS